MKLTVHTNMIAKSLKSKVQSPKSYFLLGAQCPRLLLAHELKCHGGRPNAASTKWDIRLWTHNDILSSHRQFSAPNDLVSKFGEISMGEGVFKQENSSSNSDEQALDESNGERPAHERVELLIDELRKRTAELEAANRELRRVSHYRSLFLARMSHELRTPLTSILGFSEILLDHEQLTEN